MFFSVEARTFWMVAMDETIFCLWFICKSSVGVGFE